ncbi:response regulator transcription factor [Burkholderia pyrrocinia]|uniref:Response regulator transcription factor n=1 Tax=Burkholderia pyrrocinia TaxID=60550 RepID=A0ABZ3BNM6_BURPY
MNRTDIQVVIADDHPAIVVGVCHEIDSKSGLAVVGTVNNSTDLFALIDEKGPDVVISDYAMPGGKHGDGVGLMGVLMRRYPSVRIVLYTMMDNPAIVRALLQLGILRIVHKMDDLRLLEPAVRSAVEGKRYFSPTVGLIVAQMEAGGDNPGDKLPKLTEREAEVLRLYTSGLSINEIAARLLRSKQTVSTQKVAAMRKLGVERDADLFKYAVEHGFAPSYTALVAS